MQRCPQPWRVCGDDCARDVLTCAHWVAEVEIIQWFVKVGDQIKAFDRVCEVQSDKATVEISSRYDGEVVKVHTDTGGIAHVGKPLIDLRRPAAAGRASAASGAPEAGATPTSAPPAPTPMTAPADAARDPAHSQSLATPAVRAIAKAHSIDIATVQGSGKNGRVMKEDMLRVLGGQRFDHVTLDPPVTGPVPPAEFAQRANGGHKTGSGVTPGAMAAGAQASTRLAEAGAAGPGADVFVPVRGYMRAMIKTMQAQTSVPHLVFSEEYSMDALIELKRKFQAESAGVKLTCVPRVMLALSICMHAYTHVYMHTHTCIRTYIHEYVLTYLHKYTHTTQTPTHHARMHTYRYMPFLIKALSIALSDHPELNATLSPDLEHVIQRAAHNVGIAVDSPNGTLACAGYTGSTRKHSLCKRSLAHARLHERTEPNRPRNTHTP